MSQIVFYRLSKVVISPIHLGQSAGALSTLPLPAVRQRPPIRQRRCTPALVPAHTLTIDTRPAFA